MAGDDDFTTLAQIEMPQSSQKLHIKCMIYSICGPRVQLQLQRQESTKIRLLSSLNKEVFTGVSSMRLTKLRFLF